MPELTEEEKIYIEQFDAWMKEQNARANELASSIKYSREILELNEKQLVLFKERCQLGLEEHNQWRREKGLPEI